MLTNCTLIHHIFTVSDLMLFVLSLLVGLCLSVQDSHSLYLSLVLFCQYRKVKLEKQLKYRKTKAGCGTPKKR